MTKFDRPNQFENVRWVGLRFLVCARFKNTLGAAIDLQGGKWRNSRVDFCGVKAFEIKT